MAPSETNLSTAYKADTTASTSTTNRTTSTAFNVASFISERTLTSSQSQPSTTISTQSPSRTFPTQGTNSFSQTTIENQLRGVTTSSSEAYTQPNTLQNQSTASKTANSGSKSPRQTFTTSTEATMSQSEARSIHPIGSTMHTRQSTNTLSQSLKTNESTKPPRQAMTTTGFSHSTFFTMAENHSTSSDTSITSKSSSPATTSTMMEIQSKPTTASLNFDNQSERTTTSKSVHSPKSEKLFTSSTTSFTGTASFETPTAQMKTSLTITTSKTQSSTTMGLSNFKGSMLKEEQSEEGKLLFRNSDGQSMESTRPEEQLNRRTTPSVQSTTLKIHSDNVKGIIKPLGNRSEASTKFQTQNENSTKSENHLMSDKKQENMRENSENWTKPTSQSGFSTKNGSELLLGGKTTPANQKIVKEFEENSNLPNRFTNKTGNISQSGVKNENSTNQSQHRTDSQSENSTTDVLSKWEQSEMSTKTLLLHHHSMNQSVADVRGGLTNQSGAFEEDEGWAKSSVLIRQFKEALRPGSRRNQRKCFKCDTTDGHQGKGAVRIRFRPWLSPGLDLI